MERSNFDSGSSFLSGGRGRIRGRSIHAASVGGAGGFGLHVIPASRPWLVGASGGSIGGGFSSGVGLGSGLGVGLGSGLGVGLGSGLGVSSAAGFGAGFGTGIGFGGGSGGAALISNEKFTMRVLNDRLASYLNEVHLLEKSNAELELKIRQFVDSRSSPTARNYSDSLITINELQTKILDVLEVKGVIFLNLDNAILAAEDFRIKYENELAIRQTAEADIARLKTLLDDIVLRINELMMHINTLNDDKIHLKKIHQEAMVTTRTQMSGQIHVAVNAAPQKDLTSILEEIRGQYEAISTKNRREIEGWFKGKLETLNQEFASNAQTIETSNTEMSSEKTKVQSLEVELQSELAMNVSLGEKLSETQTFYAAQLSGFQLQVTGLEEQLLQLCVNLQQQNHDYQMLLDIKSRLEMEIADYRRLLDLGAGGGALVATGMSYATKAATMAKAEAHEMLSSAVD